MIAKEKYFLQQLHFHSHSEHSIDGVFYPIELHLVHRSSAGKIAVLAFFMDMDSDAVDQYGFFQALENREQTESVIHLHKLLDSAGPHFYYEGSLTTPPCTEGVHWVVFDKHIKLHRSQVSRFRALYHRNYRPTNFESNAIKVYHSSI